MEPIFVLIPFDYLKVPLVVFFVFKNDLTIISSG